MAQLQSIDPTLLALQAANKATPRVSTTPAVSKWPLNPIPQQPQAYSTQVNPMANVWHIPWVWLSQIKQPIQSAQTMSTQTKWLPQQLPQTGTDKPNIRERLSTMWGDIVLRGKGLAEIKEAYPEFAHIDDETFKKIGWDIALRGKGIDDILKDYPELQGWDKTNFIEDIGAWIAQFPAGFGKLGKNLGANFGNFLRWVVGKEKYTAEQLKEIKDTGGTWPLADETRWVDEITNRATPAQENKGVYKVASAVTDIGGTIAIPTGAWLLWKIPWVAKIASKSPTIAKIAKWAYEWAASMQQYKLATEWETASAGETLLGAWVGAAIPAIWAIIKPLQKLAGKKAEELAVKGLLNTNDAKNIVNTLKETGEWDVWSLGRWALERGVAGKTTDDAISALKEIKTTNFKWVRSAIDDVSDKVWKLWKDNNVANAMTAVEKQVDSVNNKLWFDAVSNWEIQSIKKAALDWTLTLKQKQRAKELIDDFVGIYKKSGEVSDREVADVMDKVRGKIRSQIEDKVTQITNWKVDIKAMNREVAVASRFMEWIQNKAVANELKQFAIQWWIWWIASTEWKFEPENPVWRGKIILWAFVGRQIGKLLGDPAVIWKVWKLVDKMSDWSRKNLLEYLKYPKTVKLTQWTIGEVLSIKNEIPKYLPVPIQNGTINNGLSTVGTAGSKAFIKGIGWPVLPKSIPKTRPIIREINPNRPQG